MKIVIEPYKSKKRKTKQRAPLQFFTPWGFISEVSSNWTFSKISFQIVLILIICFFVWASK